MTNYSTAKETIKPGIKIELCKLGGGDGGRFVGAYQIQQAVSKTLENNHSDSKDLS